MAGKKKKNEPPKTHDEGVERALKLIDYLYDFKGDPKIMAPVMVEASFRMIDRVGDPDAYQTALRDAMQAAYDRLSDFKG